MITHYWTMAGFPALDQTPARLQVKAIVDRYQTLLKSKSKDQAKANKNREVFLEDLKTCLNIGKPGLRKHLMTDRVRVNMGIVTEDVQFLDDQLGPRLQAMSNKVDEEFAKRKAANLKRKASFVPQPGPSSAKSHSNDDINEEDEEEETDHQEEDDDEDYVATTRREKRSDMISVMMPRNVFMSPDLISALDRSKTSDYGTMRILAKVFTQFETPDGKRLKLDDLSLSRATIARSRNEQRTVIADQEKEKFKLNMPLYLVLGWDGKMILDILNIKHEIECMVLSGAPGYIEGKIIDAIALTDENGNPTSTGLAQAEAVLLSVMEWGAADNIVAFSFDTTASNTGIYSGAAIRMNNFLNRPILYLACRHHVYDLLAKNTFHQIVGYDPSPDVAMFKRMKEIFPLIDTAGPYLMFDIDNKQELIELFTNILTKQNVNGELFVRKDYRELCEIALVMVGGELPGKEMVWLHPGAAHKARFMAFALCSFKILAFSHLQEVRDKCFSKKVKGQEGLIFDEKTLENLWRWGQYAVQCYVPQFLLASLGRDAPINDLNLFKATLQYREVDQEVADSALETLGRHKWYLTEHVVPFALFSDNVSEEEKAQMSEKLLSLPRDEVPSLGHPDFPVVTEDTELCDLVTPKSWQFFDILKSDPKWLSESVSSWDSDPDYMKVKAFVSTVKVVNDSCERAVALASDYARILTKDSTIRRQILQVVEADRRARPGCSKAMLDN